MFLRMGIFLIAFAGGIAAQQVVIIKDVPDHSQPPASTLPSTIDSNFCAPFAFLNIIVYWENVQSHPNAQGMLGGLSPQVACEYIGWFMDTNNQGSPTRENGNTQPPAPGTYTIDQMAGMIEYVRFDAGNTFGFPFTVPPGKTASIWDIPPPLPDIFPEFEREINDGFPVKLDFLYWHILPTGDFLIDPGPPVDTIFIYQWGPIQPNTAFDPDAPWEDWNLETGELGIGHAVTGVGYIIDTLQFAIVHDNWANTPKNIAIPWTHPVLPMQMVSSMIFVHLPPVGISQEKSPESVQKFHLFQNYPNPFNPETVIRWHLTAGSHATLTVFDISGRKLDVLLDEFLPAGTHRVFFHAGDHVSGVYFYRLELGNFSETRKMILLR